MRFPSDVVEERTHQYRCLHQSTLGLSTAEYLVLLLVAVVTGMLAWSLFSDSTGESTDEAGVAIRTMEGQQVGVSARHWTGPATNSGVLGETGNTTFAGQTIGAGPSSNSTSSIELGPATRVNAPTREYQPPSPFVLIADEAPEEPIERTLAPSINLVDGSGNPIALSGSPSHYQSAAHYHANQTNTIALAQDPNAVALTTILEQRGGSANPFAPISTSQSESSTLADLDASTGTPDPIETIQSNPLGTGTGLHGESDFDYSTIGDNPFRPALEKLPENGETLQESFHIRRKASVLHVLSGLWDTVDAIVHPVRTFNELQDLTQTLIYLPDYCYHYREVCQAHALAGLFITMDYVHRFETGQLHLSDKQMGILEGAAIELVLPGPEDTVLDLAKLPSKVDNIPTNTHSDADLPETPTPNQHPHRPLRPEDGYQTIPFNLEVDSTVPASEAPWRNYAEDSKYSGLVGYVDSSNQVAIQHGDPYEFLESAKRGDAIIGSDGEPIPQPSAIFTVRDGSKPDYVIVSYNNQDQIPLPVQEGLERTLSNQLGVDVVVGGYELVRKTPYGEETIHPPPGVTTIDYEDNLTVLARGLLSSQELPSRVYRGAISEPSVIFEEGFKARGDNIDLWLHVYKHSSQDSGFIATSKSENVAGDFPNPGPAEKWVYVIEPSSEIPAYDVNRALRDNGFSNESEIVFEGEIPPEWVVGAYQYNSTSGEQIGDFISNPNYNSNSVDLPNGTTANSASNETPNPVRTCENGNCPQDFQCTGPTINPTCKSNAPSQPVDDAPNSSLDNAGNACSATDECFAAGTLVHTEQGPRPIETIQTGDYVLARHEHTFEMGYFKVVDAFQRHVPSTLRLLFRSEHGDEEIVVTHEHPFFSERGWTAAGQIQIGEKIITSDERTATLIASEEQAQAINVYNLTVQDAHTYFVGDSQMWVHNRCRCGGLGKTIRNFFSPPVRVELKGIDEPIVLDRWKRPPPVSRAEVAAFTDQVTEQGIRVKFNAGKEIQGNVKSEFKFDDPDGPTLLFRDRRPARVELIRARAQVDQYLAIGPERYALMGPRSRRSHVYRVIYQNHEQIPVRDFLRETENIRGYGDLGGYHRSVGHPDDFPWLIEEDLGQPIHPHVQGRPVTLLTPEQVPRTLYRGDARDVNVIFEQGFQSKGVRQNIVEFVTLNHPSNFVSTSSSLKSAHSLHSEGDWVYIIQPHSTPEWIDANQEIGDHIWDDEFEFIARGGVHPEDIVGAYQIRDSGAKPVDDFILNPNFAGELDDVDFLGDLDPLIEPSNLPGKAEKNSNPATASDSSETSLPEGDTETSTTNSATDFNASNSIPATGEYWTLSSDLEVERVVSASDAPRNNQIQTLFPSLNEGLVGYIDPTTKEIIVQRGEPYEFIDNAKKKPIHGRDGNPIPEDSIVFSVRGRTAHLIVEYTNPKNATSIHENLERTLANQFGENVITRDFHPEHGPYITRITRYNEETIHPPVGVTDKDYEINTKTLARAKLSPDELPDRVYRGTLSEPAVKFEEGFIARGDNDNLWLHVNAWPLEDSAFVATSTSINAAAEFPYGLPAGGTRWVYVIQPPPHISSYDINQAFPDGILAKEKEIVFQGEIPSEWIVGAYQYSERGIRMGEFISNPNYGSASMTSPNDITTNRASNETPNRVRTCEDGNCPQDFQCAGPTINPTCKSANKPSSP